VGVHVHALMRVGNEDAHAHGYEYEDEDEDEDEYEYEYEDEDAHAHGNEYEDGNEDEYEDVNIDAQTRPASPAMQATPEAFSACGSQTADFGRSMLSSASRASFTPASRAASNNPRIFIATIISATSFRLPASVPVRLL